MERNLSTSASPLNEAQLIKYYKLADKGIVHTVEKTKTNSPQDLYYLLSIVVRKFISSLANANKRFVKSLNQVSQLTTEHEQNNVFIELQNKLKFAGNELMHRLRKNIEPYQNKPTHVNELKEIILKDFKKNGVTTIQYANGTKINLVSYVAMTTRTARSETANRLAVKRAQTEGTDYVYLPPSAGSCPTCAMLSGRIYCISGKDSNYPALFGRLFNKGYYNIHPNCKCTIIPFFPNHYKKQTLKKYQQKSIRPFIDDQRELDRLQYQRSQAYNRQCWEEQREYKKLQLYYGENTPYKTLAGFRRAKRNNSAEYIKIKNETRILDSTDTLMVKYDVSKNEIASIKRYMSSEAFFINEKLRVKSPLDENEKYLCQSLDSALSKLPRSRGITLVRDLIFREEKDLKKFLQQHRTRKIIKYKAYTSTTALNEYQQSPHVKLVIKNAKKAVDLSSLNQQEKEFLYMRNQKFKVINCINRDNVEYIFLEEL